MSTTSRSNQNKTAEDYQREIDLRAAKTPGDAGNTNDTLNRLILEMSEMSADELAVLDDFVGKFMREGREEYGPLVIPDDERSLVDFILEAADEGYDHKFYLGASKLKRLQTK